jgi:hypothetical protein
VSAHEWISNLGQGVYCATQALTLDHRVTFAVDGYMADRGTTIWFGAGGTGKTQLLLWLAATVAMDPKGQPKKWLGNNVNVTGRVIILSAEDLQEDLLARTADIVRGMTDDVAEQEAICSRLDIVPFLSLSEQDFKSANPALFGRQDKGVWSPSKTLLELREHIEAWNAKAEPHDRIVGIIVDSITTLAGFETVNSEATSNFLFYLNRMTVKNNMFCAIIGHTLKNTEIDPEKPQEGAVGRLRGSPMWSTTPRSVIEIRLPVVGENLGTIRKDHEGLKDHDIVIVNVVKSNLADRERSPRYLKRLPRGAFEDVSDSVAPTEGPAFAVLKMRHEKMIVAAVTAAQSIAQDGRITVGMLAKAQEVLRTNNPGLEVMEVNPNVNPKKADPMTWSWALGIACDRGFLRYSNKGWDIKKPMAAKVKEAA